MLFGVGHVGRQMIRGVAGGAPGATLDLTFMYGALDPRITFTRASTATYFDSSGVMQTAATDGPRFDYDPVTHAVRGLLVEEQRQNIVLQSADVSNAAWSGNFAVSYVTGVSGAPDGTAAFTRVVEVASTNFHMIGQTLTIAPSTLCAASIFGKAQEVRYLQISMDDAGANGGYATFDLQTGTITQPMTVRGAGTVGTATIQAIGNGIYRCTAVAANPSAVGRTLYIFSNVPNPPFAPSYAGNSSNGMLLWGAQVEQGAFPTSYIPTTGAAVTRNQDIPTLPAGAWFVANGSWVVEAIVYEPSPTNKRLLSARAASQKGLFIEALNNCGIWDGAVAQFSGGPNTITGSAFKVGMSGNSGTVSVCLRGGPLGTGTLATIFTGGNVLQLMGNDFLSQTANGYIRRLTYWPRVLSNSELQAVTT